jgi:peptide/nickel transport system permease protein
MNTRDSLERFREFWTEFVQVKSGLVGLALLLSFLLLSIIGPLVVPFPDALSHWHDINYWQDNPDAAPPAWTNLLPWVGKKGCVSRLITSYKTEKVEEDNGVVLMKYSFAYDYRWDKAPRDIVVRFQGSGQVPVMISIARPDGLSAELYREQLDLAEGDVGRVSVARNCGQQVIEFVRSRNEDLAANLNPDLIKPIRILFSKLDANIENDPEPLKGTYTVTLSALILTDQFRLEKPAIQVSGDVSGLMGTDVSKRDVFTGVVIGIRWALIIGILTSILTVLVGVVLGVVAAYFGGATDWVLNRLYEFVYLMPVLPFLIVISAIFKPTIWTLIGIICVFFWTGPYKPVYSMALQIREETFVEASRALGASRRRIIFRHIVPILLPYSFAVMALSIPGVIVYEASVSLLGLGDSSIVTWGQILHDALTQGAVINNLWWWVIPPGLMIALMGMSFAFIGTALDKILHPKLRTR